MTIYPVRAFQDNYIWTVHNDKFAIVVDPGDAMPVCKFLDEHKLKLLAILVTHHHRDHTGGICDLVELYNTPVYGPRREKIPCLTHPLGEGDNVEFSELPVKYRVIDIPGHTSGHIAYLWDGGMFCGDTMFTGGCGKIFEGTPEQLHNSLKRLASEPEQSLVYCTHEYTEYNTPFAELCEPGNIALKRWVKDAEALRSHNQPTVPTTLQHEKATNPFLRCTEPEIIRNIELQTGAKLPQDNELAVFTAMRQWRDQF